MILPSSWQQPPKHSGSQFPVQPGQKRPGVTLARNLAANEEETHQVMSETINRASQLGKSRENRAGSFVMMNLVRSGPEIGVYRHGPGVSFLHGKKVNSHTSCIFVDVVQERLVIVLGASFIT